MRKAGDLAVLDDVDAACVRGARKAPGDGVVTRDAGARLEEGARDREARGRREVEDRHERRISSRDRNTASMPLSRMALPRRSSACVWASKCAVRTMPRWLNITL